MWYEFLCVNKGIDKSDSFSWVKFYLEECAKIPTKYYVSLWRMPNMFDQGLTASRGSFKKIFRRCISISELSLKH